ncbi:MAG: hypothetical protein ACK5Y2_13790 [Bdellovibrionales bacterium]
MKKLNLRQASLARSIGVSLHRTLLLTLSLSLALPRAWANPKSPDASEGRAYALVPISVSKDKKTKTLRFKVENREGETIDMEFQSDPREQKSFSVMRQTMEAGEKELRQRIAFYRRYLGLSTNFYRLRLGNSEADRIWFMKETANDVFVLDYFNKLPIRTKNEINRQYEASLKSTGQIVKGALTRPFSTTLHGFPVQSVLFAGVIGGLMFQQLALDYGANPMAMVQHLEHLKDPVAHLAFYTFMAANGITTDLLGRSLAKQEPSRLVRGLKAAIPYLGMSAGLMVSNLTHEVGTLGRACASHLLGSKKSEAEKALMKAAKMMGQQDPCDQALSEFFNFENKIEQYLPMMISMMISTAGASFAQVGIIRGGQWAAEKTQAGIDRVREKVSARPLPAENAPRLTHAGESPAARWSKPFTAKAAFDYASQRGSQVTRVLGLILRANPLPTGWAFHSITVGALLFSAVQTYAFLQIDTWLIPWMTKTWAQYWRASRVDKADQALRKAFELNQQNQWSFVPERSCYGSVESNGGEECYDDHSGDLRGPLKNLQKQMEHWRLQNHARFFNGVQVWTQVMNDMVRDVFATENFYKDYVNQVFLGLRVQEKNRLGMSLTPGERENTTFLPFRKMELYGINPLGHEVCTPMNQATCTKPEELALKQPDELVKLQRNRLQYVVNLVGPAFGLNSKPLPYITPGFEEDLKDFEAQEKEEAQNHDHLDRRLHTSGQRGLLLLAERLTKPSRDLVTQLLNDLQSENLEVVARALIRINQLLKAASLAERQATSKPSSQITLAVGEQRPPGEKGRPARSEKIDREALQLLAIVREHLGDPHPILQNGVGFLYAYLDYNKEKLKDVNLPREARRSGYQFERPTEFLLYQMMCGPQANSNSAATLVENSSKNETTDPQAFPSPIMASRRMFGVDLTPPQLNPPRITPTEYVEVEFPNRQTHDAAFGSSLGQLCFPGSQRPFKDLYYAKLYVGGSDGRKTPTTLFDYLNSRIDPQVLGDWKSQERRANSRIVAWWESSVKSAVRQTFDKLDRSFQTLLVDLVEGLHHPIVYEMSDDGEFYQHKQYKATDASRGLLNSNLQEARTYLKILADLETSVSGVPSRVSLKGYRGNGILKGAHDDYTPEAFASSQVELVTRFKILVDLLNEAKVVGDKNSRRVQIPKTEKSLKALQAQTVDALEKYQEHFESVPLKSTYQKEVTELAFTGLSRVVTEVSGYLLNIQLANYDALTSFDDYLKTHGREDQNSPRARTSSRFGGQ